MRLNCIKIIRSRKFKRTTDSEHVFNIAPKLLQQDFTASGPNQKWASDIAVAIVARTNGATMATLDAGGKRQTRNSPGDCFPVDWALFADHP